MSSAAVIGRQLRQQQTTNRVPGPVVPPTQYRGRVPPTSNLANNDSKIDSLSICIGADADKKFAKFSQQYSNASHDFYPHPAHRNNSDAKTNDKSKKKKDNSIKFTKHCFCVAFKALSTGVVLLVVGTVMSIIGFFAESLAIDETRLNNGTVITTINKGTKQHLHNMTYVGPVIMGLGGIVVVAACILTFEVRDTLGIKDDPKKRKTNSIEKSTTSDLGDNIITIPATPVRMATRRISTQINHIANNKMITVPMAQPDRIDPINKQPNTPISPFNSSTAFPTDEIIIEADRRKSLNKSKAGPLQQNGEKQQHHHHADRLSIISTNSTDLSYCQIPSPVDIELSDPDGCSLNMTFNKWKARCSCSGSPTNSMLMALHKIVDDINDKQTSSPSMRQQMSMTATINNHHKHHKSSTSSSSANLFFDARRQFKPINAKMIASIDDLSLYSYQSDIDSNECRSLEMAQHFNCNYNNHQQQHHDHQYNRSSSNPYNNQYINNIDKSSIMIRADIPNNKYPLLRIANDCLNYKS